LVKKINSLFSSLILLSPRDILVIQLLFGSLPIKDPGSQSVKNILPTGPFFSSVYGALRPLRQVDFEENLDLFSRGSITRRPFFPYLAVDLALVYVCFNIGFLLFSSHRCPMAGSPPSLFGNARRTNSRLRHAPRLPS